MPTPQVTLLALLGLVVVLAAVVAVAVVRHAPRSRAADLVGRGAFAEALALGVTESADRLAVATAARHLLDLDMAADLLDALLVDDPDNGDALVERGLVEAYAGRYGPAAELLRRAASVRADLGESITLHRAWLELRQGHQRRALRRFEEIEASLESKLRADLSADPLFAEWFLHAALLWQVGGDEGRAAWAWSEGLAAAPASRLADALAAERFPEGSSGLSHSSVAGKALE